ncbi:hypothetical protein FACUT_8661 [Fusarium acutatum]|uniref:Uncharacterized protein n=1 Tax=Fusarium acutatum TaxID=78861 RepID=A0A8H4JLS8_9HYPO|nr:hypothetical protein FACUT_8661 [Fusarium acutatum]
MSPGQARLGQLPGRADDALCEFGEAIISTRYPGDLIYDAGEDLLEEYKGWTVAACLLIVIYSEWSEETELSRLEHWVERFSKKENDFDTPQVAEYFGWALSYVPAPPSLQRLEVRHLYWYRDVEDTTDHEKPYGYTNVLGIVFSLLDVKFRPYILYTLYIGGFLNTLYRDDRESIHWAYDASNPVHSCFSTTLIAKKMLRSMRTRSSSEVRTGLSALEATIAWGDSWDSVMELLILASGKFIPARLRQIVAEYIICHAHITIGDIHDALASAKCGFCVDYGPLFEKDWARQD